VPEDTIRISNACRRSGGAQASASSRAGPGKARILWRRVTTALEATCVLRNGGSSAGETKGAYEAISGQRPNPAINEDGPLDALDFLGQSPVEDLRDGNDEPVPAFNERPGDCARMTAYVLSFDRSTRLRLRSWAARARTSATFRASRASECPLGSLEGIAIPSELASAIASARGWGRRPPMPSAPGRPQRTCQ
jgi:hypothetical protein